MLLKTLCKVQAMNFMTGNLIYPTISSTILLAKSFIIFFYYSKPVPFLSMILIASYSMTANTLVDDRILAFISLIFIFLISLLG